MWGGRLFLVAGGVLAIAAVVQAPGEEKAHVAAVEGAGFLGGFAVGAAAGLIFGPSVPVCSWHPPRPPDTAPIQNRLQWLRERLQAHVDAAVEHFRIHGGTTAQEEALRNNPRLYPAFRGSRIDQFAKDSIMQDLELADLITAPDFVAEPDILSAGMPEWFDITTGRAWQEHLERYGARYGTEGGVLLPTR